MKILNEEFEWHDFESNRKIREAFRGTPKKTLVAVGSCLARSLSSEKEEPDSRIKDSGIWSSPWWFDWNATWTMLQQWKTAKSTPKDVLRAKLAITSKFSPTLDCLVQIILTSPVYAWVGVAGRQEDKDIVTYLGGAEQYFLPNLASDPSNRRDLKSNVAYIHCFTSTDSLRW